MTETLDADYRLNVAALLDLTLPPECLEGIDANIELLRIHARKLEAFEITEALEAQET